MNSDKTLTANFAANTYNVVFNKNGGSGTMSNQSHTYGSSKALTSNAFTRSGFTFAGWATSAVRANAGTVDYTNGQSVTNLTTTNNGNFNLYAVWTPVSTFTLTLDVSGNGTVTAYSDNNGEFVTFTNNEAEIENEDNITITYTPAPGYHVASFNDSEDGSMPSGYDFFMEGSRTITIVFEPDNITTYTLTLNAGAHGTVTAYNNTKNYNVTFTNNEAQIAEDDEIVITYSPAAGYHVGTHTDSEQGSFDSGDGIFMDGDHTITVTFEPDVYNITYKDKGNQNFTGNNLASLPATHTYGTATNLVNATRDGYTFGGWYTSQNCTGAAVTSLGATAYTSAPTVYAKWRGAITTSVSPSNYGTVTAGGTYDLNTNVTLTATSNNDRYYKFDHWLKDGNNYAGGATITPTVTANAAYTAVFRDAAAGDITVVSNYGTATGGGHYTGGAAATLSVTANDGYTFEQWSDGNTDNPRTVYVDGDKTYTAQFRDLNTPLLASFSWDDDEIGVEQYGDGNSLCNSFYSPAGKNFYLVYAKSNSRNTKNYLQVSIQSSQSQMWGDLSFFKVGDYPVLDPGLTTGSCGYGTYWYWTLSQTNVCVAYDYDTYDLGLNILGSYLCDKSGNADDASDQSNYLGVSEGMTCKITVGKGGDPYIRLVRNSDQQCLVSVGEAKPKYNVSITAPENGTVTVSYNDGSAQSFTSGSRSIEEGTVLTVTTTPAADYHFGAWTGNGAASVTVNGDKTIGATFAQNDYFLNATYGAGGASVTRDDSGNNETVKRAGNTVTLTPNAASGYNFLAWAGDDAAKVSNNIFTFPSNGTHNTTYNVQATFQTVTYNLTYEGLYGATNSNPATYTIETATITLAAPGAREGYTFTGWTCGGSPITQIVLGSTGDKTLTANWSLNSHQLTWDANGGSLTGGTAAGTTNYGTALTAPAATREGYTFNGWNPSVPATMPDADATYTAQWNTVDYNITFHANGGSGSFMQLTYTIEDDAIDLWTEDDIEKEGYTFAGWYANSDLTTGGVVTTIPAGSTGDKEFWAAWTANTYTVSLNANGGASDQTTTATYNSGDLTSWTAPTKSGGTLTGYFTETTGGVKVINADGILVADVDGYTDASGNWIYDDNATLYAQWEDVPSVLELEDNHNSSDAWWTDYDNLRTALGEGTITVRYMRELPADKWCVFALPFGYSFRSGSTLKGCVYELGSAEYTGDGQLTFYFAPVTTKIEANRPYLYRSATGHTNPEFANVQLQAVADGSYSVDNTNTTVGGTVTLHNTTARMLLTKEKSVIYIQNNRLYYPNLTNDTWMRAFRGYFTLDGMAINHIAPRVRIVVAGETATELEVVQEDGTATKDNVRKYMKNGVLVIERNGVRYDATGARID